MVGLSSRAISSLVDCTRHQTGHRLTKRAWFGVGPATFSYFSTGLLYLQISCSLFFFLKPFWTIRCKLCKGFFLEQLCKKSPFFKGEKKSAVSIFRQWVAGGRQRDRQRTKQDPKEISTSLTDLYPNLAHSSCGWSSVRPTQQIGEENSDID